MSTGWWEFVSGVMNAHRWSQADLARRIGIDSSVVTGWKNGRQPNVENLRFFGAATGVPMLTLLVESGYIDEAEAEGKAPPLPEAEPLDVIAAVRADPNLLPEAKEHLVHGYELLLQVRRQGAGEDSSASTGPGLRAVARKRGKWTSDNDT